ncbi:hypothetical protein M0R45_026509 [Rubus argutus]|uniref:Uncharacterized protein n=1 Tax=Rubus argutus TaxID=59490 RepID=A0AAW1WXL9_RUBAR
MMAVLSERDQKGASIFVKLGSTWARWLRQWHGLRDEVDANGFGSTGWHGFEHGGCGCFGLIGKGTVLSLNWDGGNEAMGWIDGDVKHRIAGLGNWFEWLLAGGYRLG